MFSLNGVIRMNGQNVKVTTQKYIPCILTLFSQSTMLHQGVTNIPDPQMQELTSYFTLDN